MRLRRHSRETWLGAARPLGGVYAVAGAPPTRGGHGWSGGGRGWRGERTASTSAQVTHARGDAEIEVETSSEERWPDEVVEWRLTSHWVHSAAQPGATTFPLRLEADRWEQDVDVDGTPRRMVFIGNQDAWCAAGTVGGRQVQISARGWPLDDLRLVRLAPDDVPDSDGRRHR